MDVKELFEFTFYLIEYKLDSEIDIVNQEKQLKRSQTTFLLFHNTSKTATMIQNVIYECG